MEKQPKPYPLARIDLGYRERLIEFFNRCGWDGTHLVDEALKEHAHELAERQREWAREENFVLPVEVDGRDVPLIAQQTAQILASLIDPKAQT